MCSFLLTISEESDKMLSVGILGEKMSDEFLLGGIFMIFAVMGFLNPVFGVILSAIILGEGSIINYRSVIALVLVCVGICIVYWKESDKKL